jgi:fibronectin type 3 domain-containing protein
MRRVIVLASTFAAGIACVNLDVPREVAECRVGRSCQNVSSDASAAESRMDVAGVVNRKDGPDDSGAGVASKKDGSPDDGVGGTSACVQGQVAPTAPTNVVVTAGDKQIGLFWTAVPKASQYRVSRSTTETSNFAQVGLSTTTSYLDKSLTNGAVYYYVVAAGNGWCWSADSAVTSGTPSPPPDAAPGADCSDPPPTGLQASPSGSVEVTLTWAGPTLAPTSYGIWRSKVSGSGYESIATVAGTVTSYADTDATLLKDTKYYYRVTANGACSAASSEVSVTTVCLTPEVPAAPIASNSNGTITVTWPVASGANAYSVYRDSSSTGSFAEVVSSNQTALTYTDAASNLTNGQTYYYKLSASNGAGQCASPKSSTSSAMSCAPPDVPSDLKTSLRGLKQVELSWAASTGASQYAVLRGTSAGAEVDITPPSTVLTTTSYTDTAVNVDTTYYYRIRAHNGVNSACASTPSAEVTATPTSCVVLPGSKSNYIANTTKAYCFVTCWDLPLGVAGVGMNVVNFSGRTFTVNGVPMNCPSDCILPTNLAKDYSTYPTTGAYVFRVTAGPDTSADITWWSPRPGRDCQ